MSSGLRTHLGLAASLLVALVLTLMPLPDAIAMARPAWALIVTGHWVLHFPQRYNLLLAWFVGLMLDSVMPGLLGQHALAMTAAIYLLLKLGKNFHESLLWQQMLLWVPLLVIYEFILFWMDGVNGRSADPAYRWLPALTTPLLWPLLQLILTQSHPHRR